ncbi:MAG: hypothetical protein WCI37_02465 [bacterium]|jgi:hypothetical protein
MNIYVYIGLAVVFLIVCFFSWKLKPIRMNKVYFYESWKNLQKLLIDKKTWAKSVIAADKLLDEALKKRHFKGKSMGERMVSAQRYIRDNDGVWFAHKLSNKLDDSPKTRLNKTDTKEALTAVKKALQDLGALPSDKQK